MYLTSYFLILSKNDVKKNQNFDYNSFKFLKGEVIWQCKLENLDLDPGKCCRDQLWSVFVAFCTISKIDHWKCSITWWHIYTLEYFIWRSLSRLRLLKGPGFLVVWSKCEKIIIINFHMRNVVSVSSKEPPCVWYFSDCQPAFTSAKFTEETVEQGVKNVQS